MRIISDAPGQTCTRLWSYTATVARCIVEKRKMAIIFFDESIEDFPSFLHCRFIYFPLWNKWLLDNCRGWKYYNGISWRIKFDHKKTWDNISSFLGFTNGWQTRSDSRYLSQALPKLKEIFRPKEEITQKAEIMIADLQRDADMVIGVHIRRGDYATWHNGLFFFELEDYHQLMMRLQEVFKNQKVTFFISSNEDFDVDFFKGCKCKRFKKEPSGAVLDLYTLSLCNRIIGPFSSYSRWASFIGEVPLCFIESKDQQFTEDSFSRIIDFFHFENGKDIYDW